MTHSKGIFPRNLTARAAYVVPGNPVTTRPEDAVANCYPGLELDVRNLDRRFFPGLVFDFVARADNSYAYSQPDLYGAKLSYVDLYGDPEVNGESPEAQRLLKALTFSPVDLSQGNWYLDWIEVEVSEAGGKSRPHRISMSWHRPVPTHANPDARQTESSPMDGLFVWRIVRCLEPQQKLKIQLKRRDKPASKDDPTTVVLDGWRRRFTDESTGVISAAYQAGELLQSLCSPWQHDFRDCACHYWASNHPDIVFGNPSPGPILADGQSQRPELSLIHLDWLRRDRSRPVAASAQNNVTKDRPFQLDHYEINSAWKQLDFVLENHEIGSSYRPPSANAHVKPFSSPEELAHVVQHELAPLELALALEYLYARFSVLAEDEIPEEEETLREDVEFVRHSLLYTAIQEMMHLRWANELLWGLKNEGLIDSYTPILTPSQTIPIEGGQRAAKLRPLTSLAARQFVETEDPHGFIDTHYTRVAETLQHGPYSPKLAALPRLTLTDGLQHYRRLSDVKSVLEFYGDHDEHAPWLRRIELAKPEDPRVAEALKLYRQVLGDLHKGYDEQAKHAPQSAGKQLASARNTMLDLERAADQLARHGMGIPFF